MGRGPGIWQRMLLDELRDFSYLAIREVIDTGKVPRAQAVAIRRAAHLLAQNGSARQVYWWYCPKCYVSWDPLCSFDWQTHSNCRPPRRKVLVLTTDPEAGSITSLK